MQKSDTANNRILEPQLDKQEFWRSFLTTQIPLIYQMFQRHSIHTALIEELVQTTVLNAIRSRNTYDATRGSPEQWLFGIANNSLALEMRQRQLRPKYNGELLKYIQKMDSQPMPDEILESQENVERIQQAMATLEPSQQQVLTARYHEDLSTRQIAQKMHLTEKAVESLLYRARNALKIKLQEIKPLAREN